MTMKSWFELALIAMIVVLGVSVLVAWEHLRVEQIQLQEKLEEAQQQIQAANEREDTRRADLQQELKSIARQQKAVQTPQQVIQALPDVLPLPEPLVVESPAPGSTAGQASDKDGTATDMPAPKVELPAQDLKPLYDYALSCKACQEQLVAAQGDLKDEKTKTEALGRERDSALRVARGGSVLQRVERAAKWLVVGAAVGAAAARLAH